MIHYLKDNPVPAFGPDSIQILCGALDIAWHFKAARPDLVAALEAEPEPSSNWIVDGVRRRKWRRRFGTILGSN